MLLLVLLLCDANNANVAAQPHVQGEEHSRGLGGTQGQYSHDPLSLPSGPITRLRAKRFKEVLNGLIQHIGEMANAWRPDISPNQIQGSLITMIKILINPWLVFEEEMG
ncbi:hypothetical protein PanWU01x14_200270 [Parasponia andersonii]|uniref:Uncharacterized protein n=1 Tax=Parasponia andersonii TaxID=3476 RepID=A0A2P5BY34_PARAD|nr:hypothetical protein PanWU01x14_200270 [Parasponia andersonii]